MEWERLGLSNLMRMWLLYQFLTVHQLYIVWIDDTIMSIYNIQLSTVKLVPLTVHFVSNWKGLLWFVLKTNVIKKFSSNCQKCQKRINIHRLTAISYLTYKEQVKVKSRIGIFTTHKKLSVSYGDFEIKTHPKYDNTTYIQFTYNSNEFQLTIIITYSIICYSLYLYQNYAVIVAKHTECIFYRRSTRWEPHVMATNERVIVTCDDSE